MMENHGCIGGRANAFLAAAIAVLLLAGLAHAQTAADFGTKEGGKFEKSFGENWQQLALVAIAAGILFNILVYMAGMALQAENLKRYARAEGLQVTASALMIFFAVSLLYSLSSGGSAMSLFADIIGAASKIRCAAVSGGVFYIWNEYDTFGSGPLGAFKCKLQEKITALDTAYGNIYTTNYFPERALSICYMFFGAPLYCNSWDQAQHKAVEERHLLATKVVGLLMPLHAQFSLAEYLQKNMLAVFLPAGLAMRIFPFSRGLGGLFIAIAIGFFFVWPAFFVLTDASFVKVDDAGASNMAAGACFTGFKGTAILQSMASDPNAASAAEFANTSMTELLYQVTIGTMFYPFVALVLTLIFVRALTPLLGGDLGDLMKMVARLG